MRTTYVLWNAHNRHVQTFTSAWRLANIGPLLAGWSIEEFLGDVSRGIVSLEYVKRHANELAKA